MPYLLNQLADLRQICTNVMQISSSIESLPRPSRPSFTSLCPEPRSTVPTLFVPYLLNQLADLRLICTNVMQIFSAINEAQHCRRVPPSQRSVLSEGKTVFAISLESIDRFAPKFHQCDANFFCYKRSVTLPSRPSFTAICPERRKTVFAISLEPIARFAPNFHCYDAKVIFYFISPQVRRVPFHSDLS